MLLLQAMHMGKKFNYHYWWSDYAEPDIFITYTSSIYQEKYTNMNVHRGLGNSIIHLKIKRPPELVIVE